MNTSKFVSAKNPEIWESMKYRPNNDWVEENPDYKIVQENPDFLYAAGDSRNMLLLSINILGDEPSSVDAIAELMNEHREGPNSQSSPSGTRTAPATTTYTYYDVVIKQCEEESLVGQQFTLQSSTGDIKDANFSDDMYQISTDSGLGDTIINYTWTGNGQIEYDGSIISKEGMFMYTKGTPITPVPGDNNEYKGYKYMTVEEYKSEKDWDDCETFNDDPIVLDSSAFPEQEYYMKVLFGAVK